MIKFPLQVVLTAVDQFTGPLTRMTKKVNEAFRPLTEIGAGVKSWADKAGLGRVTEALGGVRSSVWGVAKAFGAAFLEISAVVGGVALTLWKVVDGTAEAGFAALRSAQKIGIGVEKYQELAFAARAVRLEQSEFDRALFKFTRTMGQAAHGNFAAAQAFHLLGVNIFDAHHKLRPADELLGEVADHLQRLGDEGVRNDDIFRLFGRGGANLAPFLKLGSKGLAEMAAEARELGGVLSDEDTKAARTFADAWHDVHEALTGVRNVIGVALFPAFTELADKIKTFVVAHRAEIAAWAKRFAAGLPERLEKLGKLFEDLVRGLTPLVKILGDLVEWLGPTETLLLAVGAAVAFTVLPAVASLIASFYTLSAAIVGTPFGWVLLAAAAITLALAAVVAEVIYLYAHWKEVTTYLSIAWDVAVLQLKSAGAAIYDAVIDPFVRAFAWIKAQFAAVSDAMPQWLKDAIGFTARVALAPVLAPIQLGNAAVGAVEQHFSGQSSVKVEFANAPQGMRVTEARSDGPDLDLSLGYSMLGN